MACQIAMVSARAFCQRQFGPLGFPHLVVGIFRIIDFQTNPLKGLDKHFMTKHIFVTGGVVSSLGKGLTSASIGMLLEQRGLSVRMQKLDPSSMLIQAR